MPEAFAAEGNKLAAKAIKIAGWALVIAILTLLTTFFIIYQTNYWGQTNIDVAKTSLNLSNWSVTLGKQGIEISNKSLQVSEEALKYTKEGVDLNKAEIEKEKADLSFSYHNLFNSSVEGIVIKTLCVIFSNPDCGQFKTAELEDNGLYYQSHLIIKGVGKRLNNVVVSLNCEDVNFYVTYSLRGKFKTADISKSYLKVEYGRLDTLDDSSLVLIYKLSEGVDSFSCKIGYVADEIQFKQFNYEFKIKT